MTSVSVSFIVVLLVALALGRGCFSDGTAEAPSKAAEIRVYELKRGNVTMKLTNWGATLMSFVLPDKNGKLDDIVLGFDSAEEYTNDTSYFGSIVGRVANRIANAQFSLNGTQYKLVPNEGKNMLHGGPKGFSDVLWRVRKYKRGGHSPFITFTYLSEDGEEGFPGKLQITLSYMLLGDWTDKLTISMKVKALDKATPVNLAQHAYWNLGGHNSGDVLSQEIEIFGCRITPVDSQLIPTGEILPVKGTPYDFLEPRTIGSQIKGLPNGYDINYVLDGEKAKNESGRRALHKAATVWDPKSGRHMELLTNQPGLQFYTSNMLKDTKGKGGYVYQPHAALCLETQKFPDSVNHPNFPSEILDAGKAYHHNMLFRFSIKS